MVENENRRNTFCKLIVFSFDPRDKRLCMENGNENRKWETHFANLLYFYLIPGWELTQNNDKNICDCQGYEIEVHSRVRTFALHYHENHRKVAKESTDEHNNVEDGK